MCGENAFERQNSRIAGHRASERRIQSARGPGWENTGGPDWPAEQARTGAVALRWLGKHVQGCGRQTGVRVPDHSTLPRAVRAPLESKRLEIIFHIDRSALAIIHPILSSYGIYSCPFAVSQATALDLHSFLEKVHLRLTKN
jgi:hypothetical protein